MKEAVIYFKPDVYLDPGVVMCLKVSKACQNLVSRCAVQKLILNIFNVGVLSIKVLWS